MSQDQYVKYDNNNIIIKELPKSGEDIQVFVRPTDSIKFPVNIPDATYQIMGGDIVMQLPAGGKITFVSMGLLAFTENSVSIGFPNGSFSLADILSQIDDVKESPAEALVTDAFVALEDEFSDKKEQEVAEKNENFSKILQEPVAAVEIKKASKLEDDISKPKEEAEANEFDAVYKPTDENPINSAISDVSNAVEAGLKFDIDLFQTQKIEDTSTTPDTIEGGGGSEYGGTQSTAEAQFQSEVLDYSARTDTLDINADNPALFDSTGVLSRTIRIKPEQPTGFGISDITIAGLPNGYEIVGGIDLGNGSWNIPASTDGTVMTGFTTNLTTGAADFVLKYAPQAAGTRIDAVFSFSTTFSTDNLLPGQNVDTPDVTQLDGTGPIQFLMREIDYDDLPEGTDPGGAIDYLDLAGDGFVLATNANYNVITTSQGNTNVTGALGKDTILGLQGDDSLYGAENDDTLSGGLGTNTLDGGTNGTQGDTVSYAYLNTQAGASGVEADLSAVGVGGTATTTAGAVSDTFIDIENLLGTEFVDTLTGNASSNILDGATGNDFLYGEDGNDTLKGSAGNDTLFGGDGDDLLDGGADIDVVSYKGSTSALGVDVTLSADGDGTATEGAYTDTLRNIENIIGSDQDDTITGSEAKNLLYGEDGIDTVIGGDGDDTIYGGIDGDSLYGGGDKDTLYGETGDDTIFGDTEDDILYGGDGLDTLQGGEGNDTLHGDAGEDKLEGNAGDDTLYGGTDKDILRGGDGDDSSYGEDGDDIIFAGLGTDFIQGDGGVDTLSYQDLTTDSIVVDLTKASNQVTKNVDSKSDTIKDDGAGVYDVEHIIGTNFTDIFIGNDSDNTFFGEGSADTLTGNGGVDYLSGGNNNDTLNGGAGDDSFDGGDQTDTVTYKDDLAGVTVDLYNSTATDGYGDTDTFTSIENITGSNLKDIITGDNGANVLDGLGGDDTFIATIGNDTIIGGDGVDFIDFSDNTTLVPGGYGVNVDLKSNSVPISGGGLYNHSISEIEGIYGTNIRDTIIGNASDNFLYGAGGNDIIQGYAGTNVLYGGMNDGSVSGNDEIRGGSGVDTIFGEDGNDVLYDSQGDDTFDGGSGSDRVDYRNGPNGSAGVTIDLTDQGSGFGEGTDTYGDTDYFVLDSIETIYGSSTNDNLTGDNNNNSIYGYEGNDIIYGLDGQDSLRGAQGNDTVYGGTGNDSIDGDAGVDTLYGEAGVDTVRGGDGDDSIYGGSDGDSLFGNAGDDFIDGGTGDDTLEGGADADSMLGGVGDDVFIYNANVSEVSGDVIDGGSDVTADTIYTPGSNDYDFSTATITDTEVLRFNTSATQTNTITDAQFNAGLTTIDGGSGINTLNIEIQSSPTFNASSMTRTSLESLYLDGTSGVATNLNLTGTDGVDTIAGGGGGDILSGLEGADTLLGNDGNDTIVGNIDGGNIIDGGDGSDTLDYSTFSTGLNISLEGTTQTSVTGGGLGASDSITNMENILGSSGDDVITVTQNENNTLFGNGGNDTFNLQNAIGNATGNVYDGGTGTDQIHVDNTTVFFGATFTDIEELLYNSASAQTLILYDTQVSTIDTIVGNGQTNTLDIWAQTNFDASNSASLNATGIESFIVRAKAGIDQELTSGTGTFTLVGGTSNDTLIGNDGGDTFLGGSGDDTIITTTTNIASESIDGEGGTDTLLFSDAVTTANLDDAALTNVATEIVQFANLANDIALNQDGVLLQGGSSTDNFNYTDADFDSLDSLDGGEGKDTLTFSDATTLSAADLANVTAVEVLSLSDNANTIDVDGMANPFETILGGALKDIITTNGGEDTVFTGAGNDTVFIDAASDTLDGGNDVDTLNITGLVDLSSSTVINFENIVTDSDLVMTVEQFNDFATIDVAGNNVSIVGNGTDNTMSLAKITNESPTSKVVFTDGVNNTTTVTDVDMDIDATTADVTLNLTTLDVDALSITTGTAATLNIDASALTANKTINIDGAGPATVTLGNDANLNATTSGNVTVNDGAGANVITTGSGADTINLTNAGLDVIDAGDGNDTIHLSHNVASIDGGGGSSDKIELNASGLDLSATTITNIEEINFNVAGASNVTMNSDDLNTIAIVGNASTNTINIANSGTINLGSANLTSIETIAFNDGVSNNITADLNGVNLLLGDSGDTLNVDTTALSSADTITGGTGVDTLVFTNGGTVEDLAFTNITNIEAITFSNSATNLTLGTQAGTIVSVTGGSSTSDVLTLNAGGSYTNISAIETLNVDRTIDLSGKITDVETLNILSTNGNVTLDATDFVSAINLNNDNTLTINNATTTTLANANFTGSTGNTTINLNAGGTSIDLSAVTFAGNVSIVGSAGDDTVTVDEGLALLNGSSGTADKLIITGGDFTSSSIINFETITVNETVSLVGAIDDDIVSSIDVASGKTLTLSATDLDGKTIDFGGAGNTLFAAGTVGSNDYANVSVSGAGNLTMNVNSSLDISSSGSDDLGGINNVDLASGATLTVNASQVSDTLSIDGNNANADLIIKTTTTDSENNFTNFVNTGSGNIILDVVEDVNKSGEGASILGDIDSLIIEAGKTLTLDANQIANLTTLNGTGILNVNALGGTTNLSGLANGSFSGTINILASNSDDTMTGSAFDDNIVYSSVAQNDVINGGGGTNTIVVTNDVDLSAIAGVNVTNVTQLNVSGNFTATVDKDFVENSSVTTYSGSTGLSDFIQVALGDGESVNLTSQTFADLKVEVNVIAGGGDSTIVGNNEVVNIITVADGTNNITTFSENDTITGGSGADTIDIGAGSDVVNAGGGDDVIKVATNSLTSSDTLDGSTGTNTLEYTNASTATIDSSDFTNVTNIQKLKLADGDNTMDFSTNAGSIVNVDGSSMTSASSNLILTTGSNINTVTGGAGDDVITYADANFSDADDIDGGGGTNKLVFSDAATLLSTDLGANVTNIDVLQLSDNANIVDLTSSTIDSLEGGSATDSVTVATVENDQLSIKTNAGDDTVFISSVPTGLIDGGTNTGTGDTLNVSGDLDLSSANIINFEKIVASGSITLDASQASGVTMAIASGQTLTIKNTSGTTTLNAANITGGQINVASLTAVLAIVGLSTKLDASSADKNITVSTANGALDIVGSTTATTSVTYTEDTTLTGSVSDIDQFSVADTMTLTTTAAKISGQSVNGDGEVSISDASTTIDLSNITNDINLLENTTLTILTIGSGDIDIASGKILTADGAVIDGKTITGAGTLNITGTGDGDLDLDSISSLVTVSITDGPTTLSNLGVNMDGSASSSNLTVDVESGVTSVTTGSGDDDIQLAANDMTSALTIDANGGTFDKITLTSSATDLTSVDFSNVSDVEEVDFFSGNDKLVLSDTSLNNVSISLGAGADTFTNTTASLASTNSVSGDAGDDNFTVDFSNLANLNIDGGANDDTITTVAGSIDLSAGNESLGLNASHIENLNISSINLTGGDGNGTSGKALEISDTDIASWTTGTAGGTLDLSITSVQAANIELNDGGTVSSLGNTTAGDYTYTFADTTILNYTIA